MISKKTSCSIRTVYSVIKKVKNREDLKRKVRSDKNQSSLKKLKKHKKGEKKNSSEYVDCTIIKKKLRLKLSK